MVARDEVPHDSRLPQPIEITVESLRTQPQHPRDVELTATDTVGSPLEVIIWKTHDIDQDWVEGRSYELTGARGKRFSTEDGERVELHSTRAFEVRELEEDQPTRLFVFGDTHVGYRHRDLSDKVELAQDIDGREIFTRCLERARKQSVDAVIHAGDVFDHRNTSGDRRVVDREIRRTVESGIPFYYVYGNHDNDRGKRLLDSSPGIHLSADTPLIGNQPVNLLGVDHSGRKFPSEAPEPSIDMLLHQNIAVIHETPYPVVDDHGTILYRYNLNKADILGFIEEAHFGIDLIITGHLHVANRGRVRGYRIPVLVTGPTAPLSTYDDESRPSTWLVTLTSEGLDINRQPLLPN